MRAIILRVIGLLLGTGAVLGAASSSDQARPPQPPTEPLHLAIQAREILRRHCSECHNTKPQRRACFDVLKHQDLLDPNRKLVLPMFPDRSRLLELIEDGSMPQNAKARVPDCELQVLRAWIKAGAGPFHPTHSESYVLARVLADVRQLGPTDRPYVRYLSLHHLLTDRESHDDLDTYRAALKRMVQLLAKPGESALKDDIEPTHTLFRLDLRALGWDKPILTGSKDDGPWQQVQLNRFDLLLLDYPYAVLPDASDDYVALGRVFLEQAPQVRPAPYVRLDWLISRGDWLLSAVRSLPGKPTAGEPALERARLLFEKPLDLAAAQAELEGLRSPEELPEVFARELQRVLDLRKVKQLASLASGGMVPRGDWERSFGPLVRHLKLGTPVLPLDSRTWPDFSPAEPTLDITLSAQDPKGKPPKTRFAIGDQMQIVVKSNKDVYIDLVWTDAEGKDNLVPLKSMDSRLVEADKPALIGPGLPAPSILVGGGATAVAAFEALQPGFEIGGPVGTDRITLFAWETSPLANEKDFPAGELFEGKDAARVVHPFYAGWYDPKTPRKPDPARMIKKTIKIEIVK